jgi:hypothetical protein
MSSLQIQLLLQINYLEYRDGLVGSIISNTGMDWSDQLSLTQGWVGRINYLKHRDGLVGSIISNTGMGWSDQLSQTQGWAGRINYLKHRDGLVGSIISNKDGLVEALRDFRLPPRISSELSSSELSRSE